MNSSETGDAGGTLLTVFHGDGQVLQAAAGNTLEVGEADFRVCGAVVQAVEQGVDTVADSVREVHVCLVFQSDGCRQSWTGEGEGASSVDGQRTLLFAADHGHAVDHALGAGIDCGIDFSLLQRFGQRAAFELRGGDGRGVSPGTGGRIGRLIRSLLVNVTGGEGEGEQGQDDSFHRVSSGLEVADV